MTIEILFFRDKDSLLREIEVIEFIFSETASPFNVTSIGMEKRRRSRIPFQRIIDVHHTF